MYNRPILQEFSGKLVIAIAYSVEPAK